MTRGKNAKYMNKSPEWNHSVCKGEQWLMQSKLFNCKSMQANGDRRRSGFSTSVVLGGVSHFQNGSSSFGNKIFSRVSGYLKKQRERFILYWKLQWLVKEFMRLHGTAAKEALHWSNKGHPRPLCEFKWFLRTSQNIRTSSINASCRVIV